MMLSSSLNIKVIILAVILLLVAFAPSYYFYNKFKQTEKLLETAQSGTSTEVKALVEKIGKLIVLPSGEEPTVATVTDLEKLKNQPFFAKAKIGDKLLIYQNAKKAILYDPIANKIIEVGPVNIDNSSITPASSPLSPTLSSQSLSPTASKLTPTIASTSSATLRVYLYNGTTTVGLTKTVENILKEKLSSVEIVDRDNAVKKDYPKTLVIGLSGNKKEEAEKIAQVIKAEISSLPAGETKPANSDILIIVGEDKK